MRLVPYSEILAHVSDLMGWETGSTGQANLDTTQWHLAKRCISRALGTVWRNSFWPDLCRTEARQFHPDYDAAEVIPAGTFRYYPPTGFYYQALQDATGQRPSTETSPGSWTTNLSYWADAVRALSADNYDAAVAYAQGDRVYDPATDAFYQVHTAGAAGTAVTDTAVWGEVTELDPFIPWTADGLLPMGSIAAIHEENPDVVRWPTPVPWTESVNGVQIRDCRLGVVWITYRLRYPRFVGDIWDPTATYTAVSDESSGPSVVVPLGAARYFGVPGRTVLRAREFHVASEVVDLLYLTTPGDGNGGTFAFDDTSTRPDDGENVIRPNNILPTDPGRWIRQPNSQQLHTQLKTWAMEQMFTITSSVYSDTLILMSADIVWPDGTEGTYSTLVVNPTWLSIDSYAMTYGSLTVTQPVMTRDETGTIVVRPELIVSTT